MGAFRTPAGFSPFASRSAQASRYEEYTMGGTNRGQAEARIDAAGTGLSISPVAETRVSGPKHERTTADKRTP